MARVVRRWSGDPWPADLARALASHDAGVWREAPVVFLHETGSTNDVALRAAADGAPDGTSVLALAQTAGRGRRGRAWASPSGAGLYFSVVIRPPAGPTAAPDSHPHGEGPGPAGLLTLMAAVAAVEAIGTAAGFTPTIKWPNDLIVERDAPQVGVPRLRRKLGGILTEGAVSDGALQHAVVGIGINLAPGAYAADVARLATNLEEEVGHPVDAFAVFAACRAALARECGRLFEGETNGLLRRWLAHAPSAVGVRVAWRAGESRATGLTAGLSPTGALVVQPDDPGAPAVHLVAGEVEWA